VTRLFLSKGLEGYYRLCINPIIKQLDAAQTLFQCYCRFILYFYIRGLFLLRKIAYLFDLVFLTFTAKPNKLMMMIMMMMINFINVSRPHSLGKSHTNLGTQLIDIKNT